MSRTEQLRLVFSSLLDTFMLLLLFVYTWNGVCKPICLYAHVSLLTGRSEKLPDILLKKVRLTEANAP